jgi:beta-glucosidase-like glycosyl hydrolase
LLADNAVNGRPACSNAELLKTLRTDWGFAGYITSDSGACNLIAASHHYANDTVHAVADCLEGGTDINSGHVYLREIEDGVESGVIPEQAVRTALRNAYGFRMRLGLFDVNSTDKNRDIPVTAIGAAEHKASSLDAARQSLVLMSNSLDRGLPFTPGKHLAVIGTDVDSITSLMEPSNYNADNICPRNNRTGVMLGSTPDFSGGINTDCLSTIWRSLSATNAKAGGRSTLLAKHCKDALDGVRCNETWSSADITRAVTLAQVADYVVVAISNAEDEGGEGLDRSSIALAPDQMAMAQAVFRALAGSHTRATLMMINGGVIGIGRQSCLCVLGFLWR